MSKNQDQRLEEMLRARRFEKPSPDLARRIVLAAQNTPQLQTLPLSQWIRGVFAELHLPRPAYVLTGALLAGVILGFNIGNEPVTRQPDAVPLYAVYYGDEDIL